MSYSESAEEILNEVQRAKAIWKDDFKNYHEAYAVILEEVYELWYEIEKKNHDKEKIRQEAIQSAAMLLRLITELT